MNEAEDLTFVESPGGKITALEKTANQKIVFEETFIPGTYRMYHSSPSSKAVSANEAESPLTRLPAGAKRFANFTVNIDPSESNPGKISEKEMRELLPGMSVQRVQDFDDLHSASMEGGTDLTTPFLLMVALMLFVEGWLIRKE